VPQALAIARGFRSDRDGGPSERAFGYAALGGIIGFMIASKVLSPQYMVWIAPMLALAAEGPADFTVVLAIGALTTAVYPYLSPALELRAPGHIVALLAVGSRNLLLIGLYGVAIRRGSKSDPAFTERPVGDPLAFADTTK
jgi:hypothetical protein